MKPTDGNLARLLVRRVTEAPHHPLYVFLDRHGAIETSLSRESLYDVASRLASRLQDQELQRRPVALFLPHGPSFVIAFWAAILVGAVPVPLTRAHSSSRARRLASYQRQESSGIPRDILEGCAAAAVLTVSARAEAVSRETGLPVMVTDAGFAESRLREPLDMRSDRAAFIQYTSGSTAAPRGVRVSHANILHNCETISRAFGIRADDVGVSWLPLHHDMGLIGHVIQPVYSGISNHFLSPTVFAARPLRWLQAMARYRGSISGGPDSAFALCNNRVAPEDAAGLDLSRWRLAYCGAERIRPATLDRFASRFRASGFARHALYPCYGLAESTLFVSGRHGLRTRPVPESGATGSDAVSVGACPPDARVTVSDPEAGTALPDGQVGEVTVSSPSVADGYHGDLAQTAERFRVQPGGARVTLRTGDLGFLQDGELYITGRSDNCIQYHGRNVFAEDIEAAVMEAEPDGILRCAVFASEPDGQEPGTRITIILEHDGQTSRSRAERHTETVPGIVSLATGVVPHQVLLWPRGSIPVTTSGKTRRNRCRDLYLRMPQKVCR
ncbi:MAG: fatty acyl-AMP ligase [Pseudohongiellaceae bacterium]